jgi:hypothetical protein
LRELVAEDPKGARMRAVQILNTLHPIARREVLEAVEARARLRQSEDAAQSIERAAERIGGARRSPGAGWGSQLETVNGVADLARSGALAFALRSIAHNIRGATRWPAIPDVVAKVLGPGALGKRPTGIDGLYDKHRARVGPALKNPQAAVKPALARNLMEAMPQSKKRDWSLASRLFALVGIKISRHEISAAVGKRK